MIDYLSCPVHLLRLSTQLLTVGLAMLLAGIVVAYGIDGQLSIPVQVAAHGATIFGPTLLKVGYVLRLLAQHQQRRGSREVYGAVA